MEQRHRVLLDEEVIEEDPRLRRAVMVLANRLMRFMRREFNGQNIERMKEITRDCRAHFRARGIDFPELVPIVLPSLGTIDFFRADLETAGIQNAVLQTVSKYRDRKIDVNELAVAVRQAWPHYRPGPMDLIGTGTPGHSRLRMH